MKAFFLDSGCGVIDFMCSLLFILYLALPIPLPLWQCVM